MTHVKNCFNVLLSGTNDAYVTVELGKEKFQTEVKEKCDNPVWNEELQM